MPSAQPTLETMEAVPSTSKFKHEPLPDSTTHIRLLEIQGVNAEEQLVCLLTAWSIEEAPDYYALSYTWGSPTPTNLIIINGCAFTAGQNCIYALKQAHASQASRLFWMDALCIDQEGTQEKNHQVAMMGQIYARSVHVLACVGPHTKDSTTLFQNINENSSLLAGIHRLTLGYNHNHTRYWVVPNPIPKSSWSALRCLFAISPRQRQALAIAFIAFMRRPYFSRVWVLQELHLAPMISLCCGMDIRSFDYLLATSMLVDFWAHASDYKESLTGSVSFVKELFSWQAWFSRKQKSCLAWQEDLRDIQPQLGCLTLASGVRGPRRLAEVLEAMRSFQCTDVRDRLFGVLALVEWGSSKPAVPDYGKDSYQIAVEVLRLYLENPLAQPVSGMAIEWPRRLWEIFDIKFEGRAIQKALIKRHGNDIIPEHSLSANGKIDLRIISNPSPPLKSRKTYFQRPSTRPRRHQDFPGHPRDRWYGAKLRSEASRAFWAALPFGSSSNKLYCRMNYSKRSSSSEHQLIKITDQNKRVFAYAQVDTKPDDWLIISEATPLSDTSPAMLTVRNIDLSRGIFRIIGQASKDRGYEGGTSFFLDETLPVFDFGSHWDPEDLFFFDWTHINHPDGAQTTKKNADWLPKVVCASKDSSFFYGPIRRNESKISRPTARLLQRSYDRRLL